MFVSEEIARRVLSRAEEIKAQKRSRVKRWRNASIALGVCAAAVIVMLFPIADVQNEYIYVTDEPIPFAAPLAPDEKAKWYTEAEHPLNSEEQYYQILHFDKKTMHADVHDVKVSLYNPSL